VPREATVSGTEGLVIRLVAEFGFVMAALLIVIMLLFTLWQSIRRRTKNQ
jgi:hypothetical protein